MYNPHMKLIDLSHPLGPETPVYSSDRQISSRRSASLANNGYNAYEFTLGMHVGTHADAPEHFIDGGGMIRDFGLENFAGEAVVLGRCGESTVDVKPGERGEDLAGRIVIVCTGFSEFYADAEKYFRKHPVFTDEFAEFLIAAKVRTVAMDIPSPDYPPYNIHKKLLSNGIFIIENLTNVAGLLGSRRIMFHAAPLALCAEGSPVRAYAYVS